jgi:hypothetical protein
MAFDVERFELPSSTTQPTDFTVSRRRSWEKILPAESPPSVITMFDPPMAQPRCGAALIRVEAFEELGWSPGEMANEIAIAAGLASCDRPPPRSEGASSLG